MKTKYIIIILIVVLLACGIGAFFFFRKPKEPKDARAETTAQATAETTAQRTDDNTNTAQDKTPIEATKVIEAIPIMGAITRQVTPEAMARLRATT